MTFLFPWLKSEITELTYGFPTTKLYYSSNGILAIELLLILVVQVLFALQDNELEDLPTSTLVSYYLTTGSAILYVLLLSAEMTLVYTTHKNLSRRFGGQLSEKLLTEPNSE